MTSVKILKENDSAQNLFPFLPSFLLISYIHNFRYDLINATIISDYHK